MFKDFRTPLFSSALIAAMAVTAPVLAQAQDDTDETATTEATAGSADAGADAAADTGAQTDDAAGEGASGENASAESGAADAAGSDSGEEQPGAPVMTKPGDDDNMPEAGTYSFDPAHSQIMFSYDHMGFSTSRGFVNGVEGSITLDPQDLASATVEASFPLSALRTVAPELDEHLKTDDFFGVEGEDMPVITFTSTGIELVDDGEEAQVTGDLTLNGVTRPVTLDVEFVGAGVDPITQTPTIGFSGETEIDRSDFNLGAFVPAVDDELEIEISVEAKLEG